MTNTPPSRKPIFHVIDDDDGANATQHAKKRNKLYQFLCIPKPNTEDLENMASSQSSNAGRTPQTTGRLSLASQASGPPIIASQASGPPIIAHQATGQPIFASQSKDARLDDHKSISSGVSAKKPLRTSSFPIAAKRLSKIFPENLPKPALKADLPALVDRIEKTEQLVYCNTLLVQASSPTTTADAGEGAISTPAIALQMKPTLTNKELNWLAEIDKNPMEKAHIRWLATRMVEDFIQDPNKDSVEIAEIVALGPILDREPYRKLLSSIIGGFEDARILDTDLLQGLVKLVQTTSPGFLVSDDLIKIFSILRIRLQGTHQQSSEHNFHLSLAVSRVLDVMAEQKVMDLNRVEEHEPLSGVLSGLKGSSDPYLMYQACYAFQALQYVPDDETALQAVVRHSSVVVDGLVKVSAVFKLDLESVLEGLGKLQEALGGVIGTASTIYDGVCTVMESGQGVFDSLKEGFGSGKKRPWYAAIRAAYALVQAGQLKDFHQVIYEAPCRRDPLFQWGICQLLGDIAFDVVWNTAVRQHAVALLGELYKNDQGWGQDESVRAWMLNIIVQIAGAENQAVSSSARKLLKKLKQHQRTTTNIPYPLKSRLSLPTSSPILSRIQKIPFVEYDLFKLKIQRLNQSHRAVYIPPLAKANLNAKDDDLFPLMEKVQEFLAGERQVMLVLGDSGAGKSTFNCHLEHLLWTNYKQGGPIPLFINLPGIREPDDDLVAKQLRDYNFESDQIKELKLHRQLILICDGYDEIQRLVNLHYTNKLNQPGQWNTKMIISCRTQFLGPTYLDRFKPQLSNQYASGKQDLFQEAVIAPFSKEQIKNYVDQYVLLEPRTWCTQDYMDRLTTVPNLLDLVRNPFLLTLALEALPGVTEGKEDLSKIKITRAQLYDTFVHHWLGANLRRLEKNNALPSNDRDMLVQLIDVGFVPSGIDYSARLAKAIFDEQNGNPMVQYAQHTDKDTWKAKFFGPQPEARLLLESSPVTRTGNLFRFVHRSMLEYFLSHVIYHPTRVVNQKYDPQMVTMSSAVTLIDANGPLFRRDLLQEHSIIQFLCDRVKSNPDFEKELRRVINLSKTDSSVATAATNAITILVKAGAHFHGADLRGVKIPGADLSNGQFDSAQLQGADLTNVILSRGWLRQANLSGARLKGVRFAELSYLDTCGHVYACTYSPDGRLLAVGVRYRGVSIYDTSTWTVIRQFASITSVHQIAFTPDNQQIVAAREDGSVQTWDCTSGREVLSMDGHTIGINSVAFSPCGKQVASAGEDGTVCLWDSQTGESQFVLKGHIKSVLSVKYSPNGCELVSGGEDESIWFWDPQTGESDVTLRAPLGRVLCLAYSPNGRRIASGHGTTNVLQLFNAATMEPGLVLRGHSDSITGVAFSPSGQWMASSSYDQTVRLWDAYSGTPLSVWTGHGTYVKCVAFSPDGLQVASGGYDGKVRLWEVGSVWSSLDPRDGGRMDQISYAPDGSTVLARDSSRVLRKWDAGTGASSESIPLEFAEPQAVSCMAFTRDISQFAVGYVDGSIHLWSRQNSIAELVLDGHSSEVRLLVYSSCRRWIASVDKINTMRLWDLDKEEHRIPVEIDKDLEGSIRIVVFSPVGDQLAVIAGRRTVRLFDLLTGELLTYNKLTNIRIVSMVYSPSGRQIAIGAEDGCIYLWDRQSEKPGAQLSGQGDWVHCIAYSPCGQWLASSSLSKKVEIWHQELVGEVESWSRVHSVCSFFGFVDNVAWNPFAHTEFVTGCEDGSIRVWKLSSDEDGNVVVKMLWGSNLGILFAEGLALDNVTDLSTVNQELLVQHGAVSPIVNHKELE